jgi:multisubunit Na+/H+ antiporter MnhB subunit
MNTTNMLFIDILLVTSLLSLAWATLTATDTRRSVILFIAFGLVLTLAWARLQAPDVALAEAAIGAGLSGALLLAAVQHQPRKVSSSEKLNAEMLDNEKQNNSNRPDLKSSAAIRWTLTLLCMALAFILIWTLLLALSSETSDILVQSVSANLANSGVSNPVTAVLLNFRAYDTLLELAVLLAAVLGIFALSEERTGYLPAGPVFNGLVSWLVPALILMAGYLLWVGAHAPGGAFQAGATLAAAGVVLRLAGKRDIGLPQGSALFMNIILLVGLGVFLLVGLTMLALGRPFLGYPPAEAGKLILLIETAAMISIAATLILAFLGGRPKSTADRSC